MSAITEPKRIGKYVVEGLLGTGSMGKVYLARQEPVGRRVAIKLLSSRIGGGFEAPVPDAGDGNWRGEILERFRGEALVAARLVHPNIVTVYDVGEEGGLPFIVMEHFPGRTLRDALRDGPIPLDAAVRVVSQIAGALDYAGRLGVVHRDVKLSNIQVDAAWKAKILDFGIAKGPGSKAITRAGFVVGCATYLSPEQARGESLDPRSDLFSLGVAFYLLVTGKRPFEAPNKRELILRRASFRAGSPGSAPTPPRELRPDLPEGLERVVLRALAPEREARYQRGAQIVRDLEAIRL